MDVANRGWVLSHADKLKGKVLEIGSWIAPGQEAIQCRDHVSKLENVIEYVGLDMREGPGVDVVCDAKNTSYPDNTWDVIICLDTLEHVDWPRDLVREAARILKKGGHLFLASVMNFPIHDYPCDYYRYTPAAITLLLQDAGLEPMDVKGFGAIDFPGIVRGIGIKL